MVPHLNPQQIAPLRGGYKHDLYSRPVNPHPTRGDLYCNPSTAQTVNRMAAIVHASPAPLPGSSHIPGDSWTAAPTNKSNKSTKTPHQSQRTDVVKPQLHSKVEHALQFTGGSKGMYHDYDDYTPPVTYVLLPIVTEYTFSPSSLENSEKNIEIMSLAVKLQGNVGDPRIHNFRGLRSCGWVCSERL
jgi:hypothetical protein